MRRISRRPRCTLNRGQTAPIPTGFDAGAFQHRRVAASMSEAYIPEQNDLTERHIVRTGRFGRVQQGSEVACINGAHKPGQGTDDLSRTTITRTAIDQGRARQVPLYAWGMAIDMNACIGCNACIVGLPVGKQHRGHRQGTGQSRGRLMHWLRIDTYFRGDMKPTLKCTSSR